MPKPIRRTEGDIVEKQLIVESVKDRYSAVARAAAEVFDDTAYCGERRIRRLFTDIWESQEDWISYVMSMNLLAIK